MCSLSLGGHVCSRPLWAGAPARLRSLAVGPFSITYRCRTRSHILLKMPAAINHVSTSRLHLQVAAAMQVIRHTGCPLLGREGCPNRHFAVGQSQKGVSSVYLHDGYRRPGPTNPLCALHLQVAAARREVEERLSARLQEVHNRLTAQQALGQDRQQEMAASSV